MLTKEKKLTTTDLRREPRKGAWPHGALRPRNCQRQRRTPRLVD